MKICFRTVFHMLLDLIFIFNNFKYSILFLYIKKIINLFNHVYNSLKLCSDKTCNPTLGVPKFPPGFGFHKASARSMNTILSQDIPCKDLILAAEPIEQFTFL